MLFNNGKREVFSSIHCFSNIIDYQNKCDPPVEKVDEFKLEFYFSMCGSNPRRDSTDISIVRKSEINCFQIRDI